MVEDPSSGRRRSQAMQNRSASVISSDSDTTCFTCCCSPCIGLCYLLCLRSMKVSTRLRIVWIWMIALSLFSGLYIRYNLYGDNKVTVTSYDMMQVQKISTFFCEGVTVLTDSPRKKLAVYLLDNEPRVNRTWTVYRSENLFVLLRGSKKLFNFYLMEGSVAKLSFCTKESVVLYVIKGSENYENYLTTMDYTVYVQSFNTIFSGCSSKTIDISESNRYYFLVGQNWRGSNVKLDFILNATTYQIHSPDSKLKDVQHMVYVPFKFQSTQAVVYQPVSIGYEEVTVHTLCQPLNYIYLSLFLGGSVTLGLLLSYFVKCLCSDPVPDTLPSPENATSDNTEPISPQQIHPTAPPLLDDESTVPWLPEPQSLPPRQTPACPPPSYESLFSNAADSEPPSYLSTTLELTRK